MTKNIFILISVIAYPAFAQFESGTIVILNQSKNQIVVAADSRAVHENVDVLDNSHCKIAALNHQIIFTSTGYARYTKLPIDAMESWDNVELARDAFHHAAKRKNGDVEVEAIADYWAKSVRDHWDSLYRLNRFSQSRVIKLAEANHGQLTSGVFIGAKGLFLRAAVISFDATNLINPIDYRVGETLTACWSCGQRERGTICAVGSHLDVAAKFCSRRKMGPKLSVNTPLIGANERTKLAVKIVELTIDAYGKTSGDVGGNVDAVTITRGSIAWNSRKQNCPANQN